MKGVKRSQSGVNAFAILSHRHARIDYRMSAKTRTSRTLAVLAVFLPWTLFGLYSGLQTHYRSALWGRPIGWGRSLFLEVTYTWIWCFATPLVLWLARRFPLLSRSWARNAGVHLVAMFTLATVTKLLWDVVAHPPYPFYDKGATLTGILKSVSSAIDIGTMLYCVVVLGSYAYDYYRELEERRLQASELERQFTNAQLQALKMQLHPHFLFNALHTISGLVHQDPHTAERMIARLSDFLRLSLEDSAVQKVPLDEELRFLDLYLDIERVRFEDRLTVRFAIDAGAREAMVPNLLLQPLVENSIRHGIAHRLADGLIVIGVRHLGETLRISVLDNGPGPDLSSTLPLSEGVGLSNTRARLERLYGDRQQLTLRSPAGGGLEVEIVIPFETASAGARLEENYAGFDRR